MKKLFYLAFLALVPTMLLEAQKTIINDPNAEARNVGNFSAVDVSGGIDLYLSQGEEDAVAVSASAVNYRDLIKTSVEKGVLKIWYQSNGWKSFSGGKNLIAYVSFRSIGSLTASGASNVYVNGKIKCTDLVLRLSGASDFKGHIETEKLSVDQSGASDAAVTGNTPLLYIKASGASNFKGYELETENCTAKVSGASDVRIKVNRELHASATGASSVRYKGAGISQDVKSSGASNVTRKM